MGKCRLWELFFHMVQDDYPPLPIGISKPLNNMLLLTFEKNPSKRATGKSLLGHDWLQNVVTPGVEEAKKSISQYQRRPTISLMIQPEDIENHVINQERNELETFSKELEKMNAEEDANILNNPQKVRILELIRKLQAKYQLVSNRLSKRYEQEKDMKKLEKIYQKRFTPDEIKEYEKGKKQIQEGIFNDIKITKELEVQMRKLKESLYEVAEANQDHTSEKLNFKKADRLYIVRKDKDTWLVENANLDGSRGPIKSAWAKIISSPTTIENLESESNTLDLVTQIEEKQRKTKLANMFGVQSSKDIDLGLSDIKKSSSVIGNNVTSPKLTRKPSPNFFSFWKNKFNGPIQISRSYFNARFTSNNYGK